MFRLKRQNSNCFLRLSFSLWVLHLLLLTPWAHSAQTGVQTPRRAGASGNDQGNDQGQRLQLQLQELNGNQAASPQGAVGGLAAPSNNAELDAAVEAHFQQKKLPGLVVLYARDGLLVYKNTKGFADVESQTKVNENHIFRLASVSKLVAAALTLREQELNRIKINDTVQSRLSEIPAHHVYRLKDLLSCRSGVRHYGEPISPESPQNWGNQTYATDLVAAENFWHDPLAGVIGQYHYSTHGYTLLGACLEQASGKPLPQLLRDTICIPHGLVTLDSEDRSVNKPQRVSLYQLNDPNNVASGNKKVAADNISWKRLGGGLECSAMDLLKFGIKLSDGKIISPASLKTMITRPDPFGSYALGCNQAIENGLEVFAKDGGQLGTSTYLWSIPERRIVMVVLINRQEAGGAAELGKKLRGIVLNASGASGKKADLIVKEFKRTSGPQFKEGHWEVGFEFKVANQGQGPANQSFVNGVRYGQNYRWTGFVQSLAPNGTEKLVSGKVKISDPNKLMPGRTVELIAMADAPIAAADTSMDPKGRIFESNESNNEGKLLVKIPGGLDEMTVAQPGSATDVPSGSAQPPKRVKPPKRAAPSQQTTPSGRAVPPGNRTQPDSGTKPKRSGRN